MRESSSIESLLNYKGPSDKELRDVLSPSKKEESSTPVAKAESTEPTGVFARPSAMQVAWKQNFPEGRNKGAENPDDIIEEFVRDVKNSGRNPKPVNLPGLDTIVATAEGSGHSEAPLNRAKRMREAEGRERDEPTTKVEKPHVEKNKIPTATQMHEAWVNARSGERKKIGREVIETALDLSRKNGMNTENCLEKKIDYSTLMKRRAETDEDVPAVSIKMLTETKGIGPLGMFLRKERETGEGVIVVNMKNANGSKSGDMFMVAHAKFKKGVNPPEVESYGITKMFTENNIEDAFNPLLIKVGRWKSDTKWLEGKITDEEYKEQRRGFWSQMGKPDKNEDVKGDVWLEKFDDYDAKVEKRDRDLLYSKEKRKVSYEKQADVLILLSEGRHKVLDSAQRAQAKVVEHADSVVDQIDNSEFAGLVNEVQARQERQRRKGPKLDRKGGRRGTEQEEADLTKGFRVKGRRRG